MFDDEDDELMYSPCDGCGDIDDEPVWHDWAGAYLCDSCTMDADEDQRDEEAYERELEERDYSGEWEEF